MAAHKHVRVAAATTVDDNVRAHTSKQLKQFNITADADATTIIGMPSVQKIAATIQQTNANAHIRHVDKFGAITNDTLVIIVQVHARPKYLHTLVQSLQMTHHIERALLIFSHDYFSPTINTIVNTITFCRVLQIFYPYSIQTHTNVFPGRSMTDCAIGVGRQQAHTMNCTGWQYADVRGQYRDEHKAQMKHHWWWKMNTVWHHGPLVHFHGYVLLLEDDHFIAPDALYVLSTIITHTDRLCADCGVLSLAMHTRTYTTYNRSVDKLGTQPFFSTMHNMGLAMNRRTWNVIRTCAQLFCTYDDYNWDYSLMPIAANCFPSHLHVLYVHAPRVFHIGEWCVRACARVHALARMVTAACTRRTRAIDTNT
jgi:alpha-1,6-mannosyl-glycoprotein beta-1,2-N-acetylglucosaminyltransferase